MEMTITRALSELKLLDKRINRTIVESNYGGFVIGDKPMNGYRSVEDLEKYIKSSFQSVGDLIKRRNQIKAAIVVSNANTEVKIAGKVMTVAEAIERKTSIDYEKTLLDKLVSTYRDIVRRINTINEDVEARLDRHLEALLGKDGKADVKGNEDFVNKFKNDNEAKIVDPLNLKEKIDELSKSIEDFESECDFILSESNTITRIKIEE